jgi:hypothetical protein
VQEIKYVCKVAPKDGHLTVYKGGYSGTVIAAAIHGGDKGDVMEIKMTESGQSLYLKHTHSLFSNQTAFELAGKKVHWKGHSVLVEDGTGICLAVYKDKLFESKDRKLGTLLVTVHGVKDIDAIVSSALARRERGDEAENEV